MNERERIRLSKLMSYILRHAPHKFNLEPDKEGFVGIEELLKAVKKIFPWVRKDDIKEVVERDEKKRYEIKEEKIRALYGHSYDVNINYEKDRESKILYHGTAAINFEKIMKEGIKPMKRKYVHLSMNERDAYITGRRHGNEVIIFSIDADCLRNRRYEIYKASMIRLVKYVPPDCIKSWEKI